MKRFQSNDPQNGRVPLLLSAPHGGQNLPSDFLRQSPLERDDLLAISDLWTDKLVQQRDDIAWISARFARVLVDLNRAPNLLDAAVIENVPPLSHAYIRAGYGVLPRFAKRGKLIHSARISAQDAQSRLECFYYPYHEALKAMMEDLRRRFGFVVVIDVHSAPQHAMQGAQIVLGNAYRRSMAPYIYEPIREIFQKYFTHVNENAPFAGGYITENYGLPSKCQNLLQVEISRHLLETPNRDFNQDFLKIWTLVVADIQRALSDLSGMKTAAQ